MVKGPGRWPVGSAIVRFLILMVAQATAGLVALTLYTAATGTSGQWARWQHIVASLGGWTVLLPLLFLMIRLDRRPAGVVLKLRAVSFWTYPITLIMVFLVGPWSALIRKMAYGEGAIATLDFHLPTGLVELASALVACALAPIFEEAVFRGYLFSLLEKRSVIAAIVGSSVMFAFPHVDPSSPWACFGHLPLALALAICVICFRSLYPPIVAHAAWNLLHSLGLSPTRWFEPTPIALAFSAVLFVLCAAAMLRQSRSSLRAT